MGRRTQFAIYSAAKSPLGRWIGAKMKVRWVALLAIEDKLIEKLSVCVSRQRFGRIENLLEILGALLGPLWKLIQSDGILMGN